MFTRAATGSPHTRGTPGKGKGVRLGRRRSRVREAPEVYGELPCACLAEEIETPGDGQIRALVTVAGNPVLSTPNGERLDRALDTLEFMVSLDIYVNETTRHADVVLPGLSPLEQSHYDVILPSWRSGTSPRTRRRRSSHRRTRCPSGGRCSASRPSPPVRATGPTATRSPISSGRGGGGRASPPRRRRSPAPPPRGASPPARPAAAPAPPPPPSR